ncbi:hypothetical protein NBG84_04020 [Streptomyces sp. CWNU-1]|uniref:Uncharacterized protein n=1 Tax=Streptomyces albipurpureus TaxID=2897419 RepID=A0ABT0UH29_9ACTN|nr:hypothetical protein [Streptomyces sp. CWNU-1]
MSVRGSAGPTTEETSDERHEGFPEDVDSALQALSVGPFAEGEAVAASARPVRYIRRCHFMVIGREGRDRGGGSCAPVCRRRPKGDQGESYASGRALAFQVISRCHGAVGNPALSDVPRDRAAGSSVSL